MVPQAHNKDGVDLVYRMAYLDTAREVARGKIDIVFIERETCKVAAVPAEFVQRVASLVAA